MSLCSLQPQRVNVDAQSEITFNQLAATLLMMSSHRGRLCSIFNTQDFGFGHVPSTPPLFRLALQLRLSAAGTFSSWMKTESVRGLMQ